MPGDDVPPGTTYHLITRYPKQTPPAITYQKLPEPVTPFGLNRSPSFQFMQRLRDFPPNLDDVVVVASTASIDIGLITKSKIPLASDVPAEKVSDTFTTTMMAEDSQRALLPMSEDMADTSPIGFGLDLSSKDSVQRPLPKEEYDASQGPLPAIIVLNNEGILSAWWFVYAESIRQGTTFPGLVVAGVAQAQQQAQTANQASSFSTAGPPNNSASGQSTFGAPSTSAASPFASALSEPSAFGSSATQGSSFGTPSVLGKSSNVFGRSMTAPLMNRKEAPTFGQSVFGATTPMGQTTQSATFGTTGGMGQRSSPWGAPSTGTAAASGSVFGQPGLNASKATSFGTSRSNTSGPSTSGAFASFASKPSPFMTASPSSGSANVFGKPTTTPFSGSSANPNNSFGAPSPKDSLTPSNLFGSGGFNLGSTFKKDDTKTGLGPKPTDNAGGSMFGSGFSDALGAAQKEIITPQSKDADMDGGDDGPSDNAQPTPADKESTTPAATPAAPKASFAQPSVPPKTGGLFGTQSQSKKTPAAVGSSQPTGFTFGAFGKPSQLTTTAPKDTPTTADQPRPSIETSPKIKEEPLSDDDGGISPLNEHEAAPPLGYDTPEASRVSKTPEPPLPPESTSKTSYAPGDSSNSSKSSDDAPLPPDFLPSKTKLKQVEAAPPEQAALPSGDMGEESEGLTDQGSYDEEDEGTDNGSGNLDEEGSGVDVAQEISPTSDSNQSPKITPESSFGAPQDKSSSGGLFGRITAPPDRQKGKPPLFGEVGKTSAPYLPPPTNTQESPRSPSPVRSSRLGDSLRPDTARSISAPGPFQALNNRKAALSRTTVPVKPQPSPEEIREQVRKQLAAEQAKAREEEEQDLSDREDERVREELATEVEGTLELDPFLAHQDYVGGDVKPGIPGQIEKVYRDINSMIDTLGINARSLKAFTKGHEMMHKPDGARTRDDLEKDDWCLIEIEDLPRIEEDLSMKLENGRTKDISNKIAECRHLRKELTNIRVKGADIVRTVDIHSDPDEVESARTAPLSLDQATQQHELRKKMARFQKLLAEAEESITMLRTKLASCNTSNGKGPPLKKPTVEAVTKTIMKITSIVEKKNSDIETLENQMRHLRFSSVASLSSREASPFTPASPRRKPPSRFSPSVNGNRHHHTPSHSSMRGRSSINGEGGTPRKGVVDVMSEDVQRYREKARRRREVNEIMKREFEKGGPRIRPL